MKTRFYCIAFSCALFFNIGNGLAAVSGSVKEKLTVCNLNDVSKKEIIKLSSIVENCKLVQFDNSDNALFKSWFTTASDKYIAVRQQSSAPFKLFNHTGKFLCNVGAVGQGPGEYSIALYDEIIDDKNGIIYLAPMTGDKILVYNNSGKFIKYIVAPNDLHKPKLHLSENGTLTVVHMPFGGDKAMAIQFDSKGKVIKQLPPQKQFIVGNFDGEIFNTRNSASLDFLHTSCDTLYHYNIEKNKILPMFTMKTNSSQKSFKQYYELPRQYFTYIFGKGLVSTDKKTNKSAFISIVNDYYGGIEMLGYIMNFRNGWFVYNLEPGQLITLIEKRLQDKTCTAQDKQKLSKLLSTLDENANNMLFIGKLKKAYE